MSDYSYDLTAKLTLFSLHAIGVNSTTTTNPRVFFVGHNEYEIGFWCTPLFLWAIAAFVLYRARHTSGRYLADCLAFALVTQLLIPLGIAVSIRLHTNGVSWFFAHYPVYVLNYATCIGTCLAYAGRRVRHGGLEQSAD
jgi:hypothetical protein